MIRLCICILLLMLPCYAKECEYKTLKSDNCNTYKYISPYQFKCINNKEYMVVCDKLLPVVDSRGKQKECQKWSVYKN